jgi:DNA repair protein RecO (recombination protein O)
MDWKDEGIVLSAYKHGESAAIVNLLTREHGRHAGLVRGGAGKRARGIYQPGNHVVVQWRARLAEHLGSYQCELTSALAAHLLDDRLRLAGLSAACALTEAALPEREPHGALFEIFAALLAALDRKDWLVLYVRWELDLLRELGFGLDLSSCVATGRNDQLAYVSPKSGHAVSLVAGEPYRHALLTLPSFLLNEEGARSAGKDGETPTGISDGLTLTGYFLEHFVFAPNNRGLPAARQRLAERLARDAI